jgi:hypothetical protein
MPVTKISDSAHGRVPMLLDEVNGAILGVWSAISTDSTKDELLWKISYLTTKLYKFHSFLSTQDNLVISADKKSKIANATAAAEQALSGQETS